MTMKSVGAHISMLDHLWLTINRMPYSSKKDLTKIYKNCRDHVVLLSNEEINCRRLHCVTHAYTTLSDQLDRMVRELDTLVTFAALLN